MTIPLTKGVGRTYRTAAQARRGGAVRDEIRTDDIRTAESMSTATQVSLRVLIADDDATVRGALHMVLERRGHRVRAVTTAHEARLVLAGEACDVALIDAQMPGDGVALRRELERDGLRGRTVLMTGDAEARRNDADAEPLLAKPFDYDVVVQLIEYLAREDVTSL
jgi:CheY-like chemotaxis protein